MQKTLSWTKPARPALLLVILLMATVMLVGCGGAKEPAAKAPTTPTAAAVVNVASAWVINSDLMDSAVYRIDVAINKQIAKIPFEGAPGGIAVSHEGVWVTDFANDKLVRIDPASHKTIASIKVGKGPKAVAIGAGAVWVGSSTDGSVSSIDIASNSVTATIKVTDTAVNGLCFADNAVWVTTVDFGLVKIDPATNKATARVNVETIPRGVVGGSGAIWVAAPLANRIIKVDSAALKISANITAGNAIGVALAKDWVAVANYKEGTVALIKASDNSAAGEIAVGKNLQSIAYGRGSLWVTSYDDNALYRIDPAAKSIIATIPVKRAGAVAISPE